MGELLARRPLPKPLKALTRPRPKGGSRTGKAISCRKLRAESAFVESWREKESQDSSRKAALALHRQHCAQAGLMLECECCYAEELEEQIVQCTVGHLFCFACVSTYVGTRLGEGGPEAVLRLGCPSTSGCTEALPPSQLRRGLPEKLLKSYEARLEKASIELALSSENAASSSSSSSSSSRGALGDSSNGRLEQCPFCDFAMVMDALPEESCRLCKEISHIPLRCDEAKEKLDKDKVKDDYRVSVEEKMSEALIRECRPCKPGSQRLAYFLFGDL
ncbi:unnamed protein product [Polarella glacialis]|uniref:RING-type domain-containing protein n=1 Tax=Polarella glacialis TaxID=89957 RepID=A0A813JM65_POLGL|nr:unnamed protein product [Polarella glacialis]